MGVVETASRGESRAGGTITSSRHGSVCLTAPARSIGSRRGTLAVVNELASWLNTKRWNVQIVAGALPRVEAPLGGMPVDLLRSWGSDAPPPDPDEGSTAVLTTAMRLRRAQPGIVHAFSAADGLAAVSAKFPFVLRREIDIQPEEFLGRPLRWQMFSMVLGSARRLVCTNRGVARSLRDVYGFEADVVPDGIDLSRFGRVETERQSGLVVCASTATGRLSGVEELVDAFSIVAHQSPAAELAFAGPVAAGDRDRWTRRASPLAQQRIRFLGQLEESRLLRWLARASVTCFPSLCEGSGREMVESLALGTPVVAVDEGVASDIVDPDVGARFPRGDAHSFARALSEVLRRHGDATSAAACRKRAESYDWDAVGPQLLEVYRGVVE